METVTTCPVCGNGQFELFLTCKDYLVSNQDFAIEQCRRCNFRLTNPRPDAAHIGSYYKSDQYVSHNDQSSGLINTAYRIVRNYTLQSKLNIIQTLNKGNGSILDVGCGTGAFLAACQQQGWRVMGTEPDADARRITADKLQTEIKADLTSLTETYEVITLWHVLEHIPNLNETIAQLRNLLSEQGHLLIAVPNSDSYDANYFGPYWAAYDVPRHLHHFTPKTIEPLFKKSGFTLIGQRPMLFDAFYISLLSTRYQSGQTDYLKSVRVGLQSNQQARRTGNPSSILYIFKKA